MVIPVLKNSFKIKVEENYVSIANMESFEVSFDGNVETWNPMELGGFQRALKTGLALSLSSDIKREYGDKGNDAIADTKFLVGEDCTKEFEWTMVDGTVVTFKAVVNVESIGGASTDVETMSVSFTVDGKPEITEGEAVEPTE